MNIINLIIVCLIITASIVYIWDIVQFPNQIGNYIVSKISKGKLNNIELKKPLGCSLCMTTWITLIIIIIFNWKLIPLCLMFGWITKYIEYLFRIIDRLLCKIFIKIEQILQ